jgi:hypothetical protein
MKRGAVLFFLFITIVPLLFSCQGIRDSDSWLASGNGEFEVKEAWTPREGYEHLCTVKKFAFGGVGYAGMTSEGEFAFRAVLKSPKAAEIFRDACLRATDEGKLYALCGLRQTDREAYDHYVAMFRVETRKVRTQSGCMWSEKPMDTVVQEIVNGSYDSHFAKK